MYYDPTVSYKNDLISNFMNSNENLINRNEKVELVYLWILMIFLSVLKFSLKFMNMQIIYLVLLSI